MCPRFFWPHTNSIETMGAIETIETIVAIETKGIEGAKGRRLYSRMNTAAFIEGGDDWRISEGLL